MPRIFKLYSSAWKWCGQMCPCPEITELLSSLEDQVEALVDSPQFFMKAHLVTGIYRGMHIIVGLCVQVWADIEYLYVQIQMTPYVMCLGECVCEYLLEKTSGDKSFSLSWILSFWRSFYHGERQSSTQNISQSWTSVTKIYMDQKNSFPLEEHFNRLLKYIMCGNHLS